MRERGQRATDLASSGPQNASCELAQRWRRFRRSLILNLTLRNIRAFVRLLAVGRPSTTVLTSLGRPHPRLQRDAQSIAVRVRLPSRPTTVLAPPGEAPRAHPGASLRRPKGAQAPRRVPARPRQARASACARRPPSASAGARSGMPHTTSQKPERELMGASFHAGAPRRETCARVFERFRSSTARPVEQARGSGRAPRARPSCHQRRPGRVHSPAGAPRHGAERLSTPSCVACTRFSLMRRPVAVRPSNHQRRQDAGCRGW